MKLSELLKKIPGLTKSKLQYFELCGYITPKKMLMDKIARRDYSDQDVDIIKRIWKYYQNGFTPKVAYQKALGEGLKEYLENGVNPFGTKLPRIAVGEKVVPSGINGFEIKTGDHIAFVVFSNSDKYHQVIFDFVMTSLKNEGMFESCYLELDNGGEERVEKVYDAIREKGIESPKDRIKIVSWEESMSWWPDGYFDAKKWDGLMWNLIEMLKPEKIGRTCVRYISENTSKFVTSLKNPEVFWEFLTILRKSLDVFPVWFVILCTYRKEDLMSEEERGRGSFVQLIDSILKSHQKLIVLTERDEMLTGLAGASYLLEACVRHERKDSKGGQA